MRDSTPSREGLSIIRLAPGWVPGFMAQTRPPAVIPLPSQEVNPICVPKIDRRLQWCKRVEFSPIVSILVDEANEVEISTCPGGCQCITSIL